MVQRGTEASRGMAAAVRAGGADGGGRAVEWARRGAKLDTRQEAEWDERMATCEGFFRERAHV
jgi:hypothetical protein